MFTQSCFIRKDTQELRDKLKEIGLEPHPCIMPKACAFLFVNRGFYSRNEIGYQEEIEKAIDCGENEQLFLALAALRDDTDSDQWFILDYNDTWPEAGDFRSKGDFAYCNTEKYYCGTDVRIAHKATPEELIKHFNHE